MISCIALLIWFLYAKSHSHGSSRHDLERIGNYLFVVPEPRRQSDVLAKKSHRMTSRPLSERMRELVQNMSSALDIAQILGSEIYGPIADTSILRGKTA